MLEYEIFSQRLSAHSSVRNTLALSSELADALRLGLPDQP